MRTHGWPAMAGSLLAGSLLMERSLRADDYTFVQRVDLGSFTLAAGESFGFGVGLGGTPLGVVGFSLEFDYSEPIADGSLASDLQVIMTAPDSRVFTVGGFDTPPHTFWSFQGEGSQGPGHYGDDPADLFLVWKSSPQPNLIWVGDLVNDRAGDPNPNTYSNVCVSFYIGPCEGDVNHTPQVDVEDLVAVVLAWGACGFPCPADINDDGVVDVQDLVLVILNWGDCF